MVLQKFPSGVVPLLELMLVMLEEPEAGVSADAGPATPTRTAARAIVTIPARRVLAIMVRNISEKISFRYPIEDIPAKDQHLRIISPATP